MPAYRCATTSGTQPDRVRAGQVAASVDGFHPIEAMPRVALRRDFHDQAIVVLAPASQEAGVDASVGRTADVAPTVSLYHHALEGDAGAKLGFPFEKGIRQRITSEGLHADHLACDRATTHPRTFAWAGPTAGSKRFKIDAFGKNRAGWIKFKARPGQIGRAHV